MTNTNTPDNSAGFLPSEEKPKMTEAQAFLKVQQDKEAFLKTELEKVETSQHDAEAQAAEQQLDQAA